MPIQIVNHAALSEPERQELARSQKPPRAIAEILTQDEYTHDVVLPEGSGRYLAFDTT